MAGILVVDDSPSMRRMLMFALRSAGHEVTAAEDGRAALAAAAESRSIDLVLSDVNMPGMSGLELVGALRRQPRYRSTPILMLTTETSDSLKFEARTAGASGWMAKPFDPVRLVATVEQLLQRGAGAVVEGGR